MVATEPFRLPETPQGQYPDSGRVRLRGDRTGVYQLARAGAEGWVRARKYDPLSKHRMVYIEWDASHWSYNAQDNMWAFEDHFEKVQDDTMSKDPELKALLEALAKKLDEPETDDVDDLDNLEIEARDEQDTLDADTYTPSSDEQYTGTLRAALGAAKTADAFLVVAIGRTQDPNDSSTPILIPQVYKADRTEAAGILLGAQTAQTAMMFHQMLAVDRIRQVSEPD